MKMFRSNMSVSGCVWESPVARSTATLAFVFSLASVFKTINKNLLVKNLFKTGKKNFLKTETNQRDGDTHKKQWKIVSFTLQNGNLSSTVFLINETKAFTAMMPWSNLHWRFPCLLLSEGL